MTTHDLLKARLNVVRRQFNQVFDRFTDADLPWRPAPTAKSVAEQILEIVDKDRESLRWLQTGTWPDDEPSSFDVETATLAEMRAAMQRVRQNTLSYIDSLSESELAHLHASPDGWLEALGLPECPRSEILRNIAAHEWYHVGQLVTYRCLLGDDPDTW